MSPDTSKWMTGYVQGSIVIFAFLALTLVLVTWGNPHPEVWQIVSGTILGSLGVLGLMVLFIRHNLLPALSQKIMSALIRRRNIGIVSMSLMASTAWLMSKTSNDNISIDVISITALVFLAIACCLLPLVLFNISVSRTNVIVKRVRCGTMVSTMLISYTLYSALAMAG